MPKFCAKNIKRPMTNDEAESFILKAKIGTMIDAITLISATISQ